MTSNSSSELDVYAESMFASPDPEIRRRANDQLTTLTKEGSDGTLLLSALTQSTNQYTLLFVAQGLVLWFKCNIKYLDQNKKLDIVVHGCGECVKRITLAGAPRHVVLSLLTCYARSTKLCFDAEPWLKEAINFAIDLLKSNSFDDKLHFVGILLLTTLVTEFSRHDSSKTETFMTFVHHRRCSNNFRDECLLDIFKVAVSELERAGVNNSAAIASPGIGNSNNNNNNNIDITINSGNNNNNNNNVNSGNYVGEIVEFVKECLSYDFMAVKIDETEEAYSAQFPSSWKEFLLSSRTRQILWGQHASLPYPLCATLIVGLGNLCGMRRTFFDSTEERIEYLNTILEPLVEATTIRDGRFSSPHYVTLFAEACLRIIGPCGYRDLCECKMFVRWVQAIANLSADIFAIPFGQDGSFTTATTLLSFWAQLSTSRRLYTSSDSAQKDLEFVTPPLVIGFFESRVKLPNVFGGGNITNTTATTTTPPPPPLSSSSMTNMGPMASSTTSSLAVAGNASVNSTNAVGALSGSTTPVLSSLVTPPTLHNASTISPPSSLPPNVTTLSNFPSSNQFNISNNINISNSNNNSNALAQQMQSLLLLEYNVADDGDYESVLEAITTQTSSFATTMLLEYGSAMSTLSSYLHNRVGPSILNAPMSTAWLFFFAGSIVRCVLPHIEQDSVSACSSFFTFCTECVAHCRMNSTYNLIKNALATANNSNSNTTTTTTNSNNSNSNATLIEEDAIFYSNLVERGILFFLTQVENILVGVHLSSGTGNVVTNVFHSSKELFQFILNHTGHNLLRAVRDESDEEAAFLIKSSIDVIREACRDISIHTLSELTFDLPPVTTLPLSQSLRTYKLRTNLYTVLWPLFQRDKYTPQQLVQFLQPIMSCMQQDVSQSANGGIFIAGWLRDLRGVVIALRHEPVAFGDFIDWCGDESDIFTQLLSSPAGQVPIVVISFLRFYCELVQSTGWREVLLNDNHTIRGLRVFKQLCGFIQLIIQQSITDAHVRAVSAGQMLDGAYTMMIKPLTLSIMCVERCLNSGFVPLGAMWFYNDYTYDETLLGLLRMINVFPKVLMKQYERVPCAITSLLQSVVEDDAYRPLISLTTPELESLLLFTLTLASDESIKTETLIGALSFLAFIAGFVKEVKALSLSPQLDAEMKRNELQSQFTATPPPPNNNNNISSSSSQPSPSGVNQSMNVNSQLPSSSSSFTTFINNTLGNNINNNSSSGSNTNNNNNNNNNNIHTPVQLPTSYSAPGTGRISGTPGNINNTSSNENGYGEGVTAHSKQLLRNAFAQLLEPIPSLWQQLIAVAMNIIVCQDRLVEPSARIVYPIIDAHPPFWYEFVESFVKTYPERKQRKLEDAFSSLLKAAESQERFLSETYTFRAQVRNL